jgi:hypothetical protein
MSQTFSSMTCGMLVVVVSACQSATKNRHGYSLPAGDPVLQHAVVVAEMQAPGRAHAGEDAFSNIV